MLDGKKKQNAQRLRIYITCEREDIGFAKAFAGDLRSVGADVSISTPSRLTTMWLSNMQEWAQSVVDRRTDYHWLVGVVSPYVERKRYSSVVTAEISVSLDSPSASVVLINALPFHKDRLPDDFHGLVHFDATRNYQSALAGLMQHIGLGTPATPNMPTAPVTSPSPSNSRVPNRRLDANKPSTTTASVFISYSRTDVNFVTRLISDLHAHDISVWWDHERLKPGTPDWDAAIRRGITSSRGLIYVASEDAAASPSVRDELIVARDNNIAIYPFWVRGDKWSNCAPLGLLQTQYSDARGDNYPGAVQALVASIIGTARE